MYTWQPLDIQQADEAVLGCSVEQLMSQRFTSPAAAVDHWSALRPGAICLVIDGSAYTYLEVKTLSDECALALTALGVASGDRVILELENSLGLIAAFLALNRLSAIAVILSPRLSSNERQQITDHALATGRVCQSPALSSDDGGRAEDRSPPDRHGPARRRRAGHDRLRRPGHRLFRIR